MKYTIEYDMSSSNIILPDYKPPRNKVKGDFQVQLLNLSETGIYSLVIRFIHIRTVLDRF